jgi:hypothetical protein
MIAFEFEVRPYLADTFVFLLERNNLFDVAMVVLLAVATDSDFVFQLLQEFDLVSCAVSRAR